MKWHFTSPKVPGLKLHHQFFYKRLSDSKPLQISRTFLSILADFNNAVWFWFLPISSLFPKSLKTVAKAPTTIGITVTFIYHSLFWLSNKIQILVEFFAIFSFHSMVHQNGKIHLLTVGRVFANGSRDQCSIPGCVIPKTFKMVLDTSLLNAQHYNVHIKSKVEQSKERSSALPYTLV